MTRSTGRRALTLFTFLVGALGFAASSYGHALEPGPPIEATIALSIMFVAAEIMHSRQGRTGLTERYPWIVAFIFGLLHGFGFAGALAQIGLPQTSIPIALLFFSYKRVLLSRTSYTLIFIFLGLHAIGAHQKISAPAPFKGTLKETCRCYP